MSSTEPPQSTELPRTGEVTTINPDPIQLRLPIRTLRLRYLPTTTTKTTTVTKFSYHDLVSTPTKPTNTTKPKISTTNNNTTIETDKSQVPNWLSQVPTRLLRNVREGKHKYEGGGGEEGLGGMDKTPTVSPHPTFLNKVLVPSIREFLTTATGNFGTDRPPLGGEKEEWEEGTKFYLKLTKGKGNSPVYYFSLEEYPDLPSKSATEIADTEFTTTTTLTAYLATGTESSSVPSTDLGGYGVPAWCLPNSEEEGSLGPPIEFTILPDYLLPTYPNLIIHLPPELIKDDINLTKTTTLLLPTPTYFSSYFDGVTLGSGRYNFTMTVKHGRTDQFQVEGYNESDDELVGIVRYPETKVTFLPSIDEKLVAPSPLEFTKGTPDWVTKMFGNPGQRLANLLTTTFTTSHHHSTTILPTLGIISGNPGVGKAWLTQELATHHHLPSHLIHLGHLLDLNPTPNLIRGLRTTITSLPSTHSHLLILDRAEEIFPASGNSLPILALIEAVRNWNRQGPHRLLVLCLTSHPKQLHSYLVTHSQFRVDLPTPTPSQRTAILTYRLHQLAIPVEVGVVAEVAEGCSGYLLADLFTLAKAGTASLTLTATPGEIKTSLLRAKRWIQLPHLSHHQPTLQKIDPVHFDEIGGLDEAKASLRRLTMQCSREKRQHLLTLGIPLSRGALLYGPPGTGKTLLGKALATEAHANFLPTRIPDLIRGEIGASEAALATLFRSAKAAAPCILFFDELDAMFPHRDQTSPHAARLCAQFSLELDHLTHHPVFVVATTNHPLAIDPSLLRPGRLDYHLYLPPPSPTDRATILHHLLTPHLPPNSSSDLLTTLLPPLVLATDGFTGADLTALVHRTLHHSPHPSLTLDLLLSPLHPTHPHPILPSVSPHHLIEYTRFQNPDSSLEELQSD